MLDATTYPRTTRRAVRSSSGRVAVAGALLLAATLSAGCRQDMHDTPRYEALEALPYLVRANPPPSRPPGC